MNENELIDTSLDSMPVAEEKIAEADGLEDSSLVPVPVASLQVEENEDMVRRKRRVAEILAGVRPNDPKYNGHNGLTISHVEHDKTNQASERSDLDTALSTWAIYRNVFGNEDMNDDTRLQFAHMYADPLGLPAQLLADSEEAFKMAQDQYTIAQKKAILDGKPFSGQTLKEMYPELADIGMDDPVSASIALKKADEIRRTQKIIGSGNSLWDATFGYMGNSWKAGIDDWNDSVVMAKAMSGEISQKDAEEKLSTKSNAQEAVDSADDATGILVGQGLRMLANMYKSMGKGVENVAPALQIVAQNPTFLNAARNAIIFGGAVAGAGLTTLGVGVSIAATPVLIATAVAALGLGAISTFFGTYHQSKAQNYWEYIHKKNSNGTNMYTKDEAISLAGKSAFGQALIEAIGLEATLKPVSKAFGKSAAKEIIQNAMVREKVLDAGRAYFAKQAFKEFGKRTIANTAIEAGEEGVQNIYGDLMENLYGKDTHSAMSMMEGAVDAMVQAVPASLALGLVGGGAGGIGTYRGLRSLSRYELQSIKDEIKRENEAGMLKELVKARDESTLNQKSPTVYGNVIGKQLERTGKGKIYVDAISLAQEEQGLNTLNELENQGVVKAEDVSRAITEGSPLEVDAGKFMQTATEDTVNQVMEHATMEKGGKTLAQIKEFRNRMRKLNGLKDASAKEKEEMITEMLLDEVFPSTKEDITQYESVSKRDDGNLNVITKDGEMKVIKDPSSAIRDREYARQVLEGGLDGVEERIQKEIDDAMDFWKDTIEGEEARKDFESRKETGKSTAHVDMIDYGDGKRKKVFVNMPYYKKAYANLGRGPRDLKEVYDSQQEVMMDEYSHYESFNNEYKPIIEEAKARVESLMRVKDQLGKVLKDKEELLARKTLSKESYEEIYKPMVAELEKGNEAIKKSAKATALLYAKQAEVFKKNYGIPFEMFKVLVGGEGVLQDGKLGMNQNNINFERVARKRLEKDIKQWEFNLKKYANTTLTSNAIRVMYTPLALHLAGIPLLPIYTYGSSITHSIRSAHDGMTLSVMKKIPRAMAEPLFVYKSYKGPQNHDRYVVALNLNDENGAPIICIIEINNQAKKIDLTFNKLVNAYGKDKKTVEGIVPAYDWIDKAIENQQIVFVNRKRLSHFLTQTVGSNPPTLSMKETYESLLTDPSIPDEETLGKLKEKHKGYYQFAGENAPHEKDLVAYHNISERNLKKSIALGGLPVPSIAITKKDGTFDKFGEITFIMPKEMVDPKDTPVLSRDAWTSTVPIIRRPLNNSFVADYAKKYIEPLWGKYHGEIDSGDIISADDVRFIKVNQAEYAVQSFLDSDAAKYLYLDEKGMLPYIEGKSSNEIMQLVNEVLSSKHTEELFHAWKEEMREKLLDNPIIEKNNKPATLENIVEEMLGGLVNAQKSFAGFGKGNVIASSARKIRSLNEMHKLADEKIDVNSSIEDGTDESKQYKDVMEHMEQFIDGMSAFYKWENQSNARSDAAEVLMDIVQEKGTFEEISEKHDFVNVNNDLQELAKIIVEEVNSLPVKYFEAKPQRAVSFNEVLGAVVPEGASQETIDFLESQGIKVEKYNPSNEGERLEKAKELGTNLDAYFQKEKKSTILGAYDPKANTLEIFQGANESTPMHEGAHAYLTMLSRLSSLTEEEASQYFDGDVAKARDSLKKIKSDVTTIREWASYSKEHMEEYVGSGLEKEFKKYEEDIKKGVKGAKERFIQERFARGFEKYLKEGTAPSKEIKTVFWRFKRWLSEIYKQANALGKVKLSPEIKAIYDGMLATHEEIEAWANDRELELIDKTLDLTKNEEENYQTWLEETKEKAKDALMESYMEELKGNYLKEVEEVAGNEEIKEQYLKKLAEENPYYKVEQIFHSNLFATKEEAWKHVKDTLYPTYTMQQAQRAWADDMKVFGTSEAKWQEEIGKQKQQYLDMLLNSSSLKEEAESYLNSPEGRMRLSNMEAKMMDRKVNDYIRIVTKMRFDLYSAKNRGEVAYEIKERLGLLTDEEKAKATKAKEQKQKKEEKETKEPKIKEPKATGKENNQLAKSKEEIKELETKLKAISESLKGISSRLKENKKQMREDARNTLEGRKLPQATSWKWWFNKAEQAGIKAREAMVKKDFATMAFYKEEEQKAFIMAKQAKANEEEISKTLHGGGKLTTPTKDKNDIERYGVMGIINRIGRKEKPVLLKDDARYFIQHIAYVVGLTKQDGRLPLDEQGVEREFNWEWLAQELDPLSYMTNNTDAKIEIPIAPWMRELFTSGKNISINDLTLEQFRDLMQAIKAVYKIGRREYEGNTLGTSFDNAEMEIDNELVRRFGKQRKDLRIEKLNQSWWEERVKNLKSAFQELTITEILVERLGSKAYKYLWEPIDKATKKNREMKEEAKRTIQNIWKIYSIKEWQSMRTDRKYELGKDALGGPILYTKEQVLAMALNWGTESNRERIMETLGVNDNAIMEFLDENMDKRDWEFVQKIWDHLNSYYPERNRIQNDLYGVPLGKVPGVPILLKDGTKIKGQYYRIKYDPDTSVRASELSANEIAEQSKEGLSAFALGMGSTKKRMQNANGQHVRLDLNVYTEAVNEAIQHISMREATVDVFKLLSRKSIQGNISEMLGKETYDMIKNWVTDNWHSPIIETNQWDGWLNRIRGSYTFAVMAYRTSTAILNVTNIFPMIRRMGAENALHAVSSYYFGNGSMKEKRAFIMGKSAFMRDRAATMDRDLQRGFDLPTQKKESKIHATLTHGKYGTDTINSAGYRLIAETDMILSLPEWLATYQGAVRKMQLENNGNLSLEEIDQEAIRLADKAVRETFGSGEVKDRPKILRRNTIVSQFLPFYSYSNLILNHFIRSGYKLADEGDYKPLAMDVLYLWIFSGFVEGCVRAAMSNDDDDRKWEDRIIYSFSNGGPIQGIPFVRDFLPYAVNRAIGKRGGSAAPSAPITSTFELFENVVNAMRKGDTIDTMKEINRVANRSVLALPDTLTDAFWNSLKVMTSEDKYSLTDYLYSVIFDRTPKKEKKK